MTYLTKTLLLQKREYQDAIDIYTALLRSCQATSESKFGIVGQLIASTLHNICVLHLWKVLLGGVSIDESEEFDLALPYARECLRIKSENSCEDVLMVVSRIVTCAASRVSWSHLSRSF